MHLTTDLPNEMRLETFDDAPGHYVIVVCCSCGCKSASQALEADTESEAKELHAFCVECASRRRTAH